MGREIIGTGGPGKVQTDIRRMLIFSAAGVAIVLAVFWTLGRSVHR
jgi:hypothetical protein